MANIKSAKKRIKVISKKTLRNKMIKSSTKKQLQLLAKKLSLLSTEHTQKESSTRMLLQEENQQSRDFTTLCNYKKALQKKGFFIFPDIQKK